MVMCEIQASNVKWVEMHASIYAIQVKRLLSTLTVLVVTADALGHFETG